MTASYLKLPQKELKERTENAWKLLNPCQVCPRKCKIDRIKKEKRGFCQMGKNPTVSSYYPHHWEEKCISGQRGSGIIFFTSCNAACVYCQNWEISQLRVGEKVSIAGLAEIMVKLQDMDCHNINLCTPSIWVPQILKALVVAIKKGLKLPLVYNTGGYDSVRALKLLDGIVDIYMPDIKYSDNEMGFRYSNVVNYWDRVQKAVREMHHQVGDLIIKEGLAQKGLLVRHLVLPGGIAGTKKVMEFIASLSKNSYVNIMDQYRPSHRAFLYPEINRRITQKEYSKARKLAKEAGLYRFD